MRLFILIVLYVMSLVGFGQSYRWALSDTADATNGLSVAVDQSGNVAVVKSYQMTSNVNGNYIALYDSTGNILWTKNIFGFNLEYGAIACDKSGNVLYTAAFNTYIKVDGVQYNSSCSGCVNMVLIKYNQQGVFQWIKYTTGSDALGRCVTADENNNIYVAGNIQGSVNFGTVNVTNPGYALNFIAKYDAVGNFRWVKTPSGNDCSSAFGLVLKANRFSECYIAGSFTGPIHFGNIILPGYGDEDTYLAKLDSSGNWLWAKHGGGVYQDATYGLDVDNAGNAYLTGFYGSPTGNFSPFTFTNTTNEDYFLTKYDPNGNVQWALHGAPSGYWANSFCVDSAGNSYMVTGNKFLLKYDTWGMVSWSDIRGASNVRMVSDKKQSVYITGHLSGQVAFGNDTITPLKPCQFYLAKLYDPPPVTTSLKSMNQESGVLVYPNPARDNITIEDFQNGEVVNIINSTGQTVYSDKVLKTNRKYTQININHLAKGLYLLEIMDGQGHIIGTKKLVVQ